MLAAAAVCAAVVAAAAKPHIVSFIIDDTGFYDTQVHNPDSFMTEHIGELAKAGITLERHHTYLYCSPTRRSFLSGRFPVHITGKQAPICSDFLPLNFTLLPAKLKQVGYETHMVGKGHLGYQTMDHLPVNRGFDTHVGYLAAAEDYHWGNAGKQGPAQCTPHSACKKDMWHNLLPGTDVEGEIYYSANFYTDQAISLIRKRDQSKPFYLHQTYQSVHGPFEEPPEWEQIPQGSVWWSHVWGSMLNCLDKGIGNITAELHTQGMYDNTLIVLTSDNGGDCGFGPGKPANNYPLKGRKCTPWDGGTRTVAFVSGGYLPEALRGTKSDVLVHVSDWYATLTTLVGVDPADAVEHGGAVHDIDGVDIWPAITGANKTNPRATPGEEGEPAWVPPTEFSILAQFANGTIMKFISQAQLTNVFMANGTQVMDTMPCINDSFAGAADLIPEMEQGLQDPEGVTAEQFAARGGAPCKVCTPKAPCLFDVTADPGETTNLAAERPAVAAMMAAKLASYQPYVTGQMTKEELDKYDCQNEGQVWGNFSGPCCKPKTG